jgi:hypothetical protein
MMRTLFGLLAGFLVLVSITITARYGGLTRMGDILIRAILIAFGLACVGTETFGTYEFLWDKYHAWNYLVVGGIIVTSLAAVLPLAAERARRHRMWGLWAVCWLAVPLTLAFVSTAAVQRTGAVVDLDEAGRQQRDIAIATASKAESEAEKQLKSDNETVKRNCDAWGPICTKAKNDQHATEAKLAAARTVLVTNGVSIDDGMARRIVAYAHAIGLTSLTKEQVQLYHPMLLPLALAILGSVCIAIGARGGHKQPIRTWRMPSLCRRRDISPEAALSAMTRDPVDTKPEPVVEDASPVVIPPAPKPKLIASNPKQLVGSVKRILTDNMESCQGGKVEIAECGARYRAVCKAEGKRSVTKDQFIAEIDEFCMAIGIKRRSIGGHLYLMDVQLVPELMRSTHKLRGEKQ